MKTYERAVGKILDHVIEIVAEVKHDICMENYDDAERKIELLEQLLSTLNEKNYK